MDFALYEGLQNKSNIFEVKRQDRQMELQILQAQEQRSEKKLAKSAEIDAKMQEYFNTVNQLDVLEKDKERIRATDQTLRGDVIAKVAQYGGNLEHFAYGGGAGVLQAYQNNLLSSEAVTGAIANKQNVAQWKHAQANGLFVKEVGVTVPEFNPESGEMEMVNKKVSMDEAHKYFEKGVIDKLPYDGAEKDIKVGPEMFQKIFKDPRNPYSQDTEVVPQDVYTWALEHGSSDEQARYKAEKYQTMIDQGATKWRYKSGDMMKLKIQQQQLANARQSFKQNQQQMDKKLTSSFKMDMMARVRNLKAGKDATLYKEDKEFFANQFGFVKGEDGRYTSGAGSVTVFDRFDEENPNPKKYDLSDFSNFFPTGYHKGKDGKTYLKLNATTNPDADDDAMPAYEGMFGLEQYNDGVHLNNFTKKNDEWFGNSTYEGDVYLDVSNYFRNEFDQTYLNEQLAVSANANYTPASAQVTDQQRYQNSSGQLNEMILMGVQSGLTEQQATEMMYEWSMSGQGDQSNPNAGGSQKHEEDMDKYYRE